jgi:hypothetical protein
MGQEFSGKLVYLAPKMRFPALTYLKHLLTNYNRRDFVDMGLGIEARFERCQRYWSEHLLRCRNFIENSLSIPGHFAILGSGRLLDLPTGFLNEPNNKIDLYDADPSARPNLSKFKAALCWHNCDLTETLDSWTNLLSVACKHSEQEALATLKGLNAPRISIGRGATGIISLNILSQVGLYWRDRAESLLKKHLDIETNTDGELPNPWETILKETVRALQLQHVEGLAELLNRSVNTQVVIIFDTAWHYYQLGESVPPPVDLDLSDDKIAKRAVAALEIDPLAELEAATAAKASQVEHWQWHIAPQYVEQKDFGVIHSVTAASYLK